MSLKHGILGFLNYGKMSGYELQKAFSESIDFFWHAQASQIYRELAKMEKENLVVYENIIQTSKPDKKEYTITEDGKKEFFAWLTESESKNPFSDFRSEFLMQIFFSGSLEVNQSIKRIEQFRDDCIQYVMGLQNTSQSIEHYETMVDETSAPIYWNLTADFGKFYIKMCIEWATHAIKQLKKELD